MIDDEEEHLGNDLGAGWRTSPGWARQQLVELAGQSPRPYIIAADGGAAHLAEPDIQPDLIIGDSDSIPEGFSPMFPGKRCLLPKNFTDGEAAFAYLFEHCCQGRIAVFAALGGRLDHLLANVFLPLQWPDQAPRLTIFSDDCEAVYSLGHAEISGCPGDTLSIIRSPRRSRDHPDQFSL